MKLRLLILLVLIKSLAIGQNKVNPPIKIGERYCFDSASTIGLIQIDILKRGCISELVICDSVSGLKDIQINEQSFQIDTYQKIIHNDSLAMNSQKMIIGLQAEDINSLNALVKSLNRKAKGFKRGFWTGTGVVVVSIIVVPVAIKQIKKRL